jgi:hypothetical protein
MIDYVRTCQWITNEPGYGCEADYCDAPVVAPGKSWCMSHYMRVFHHGLVPVRRNAEEVNINDGHSD